MNEEYIKAFVENMKRKVADLFSVNAELETLVAFKDAEIAQWKDKFEKATAKTDEAASE